MREREQREREREQRDGLAREAPAGPAIRRDAPGPPERRDDRRGNGNPGDRRDWRDGRDGGRGRGGDAPAPLPPVPMIPYVPPVEEIRPKREARTNGAVTYCILYRESPLSGQLPALTAAAASAVSLLISIQSSAARLLHGESLGVEKAFCERSNCTLTPLSRAPSQPLSVEELIKKRAVEKAADAKVRASSEPGVRCGRSASPVLSPHVAFVTPRPVVCSRSSCPRPSARRSRSRRRKRPRLRGERACSLL